MTIGAIILDIVILIVIVLNMGIIYNFKTVINHL